MFDQDGLAADGADAFVQRTFMLRGSLREWTESPEATSVTVIGGSSVQDPSAEVLSRWAVNVQSANVFGLAPGDPGYPNVNRATNPDYVGYVKPLVVYDRSLVSQSAVDWVCRRTYDAACTARVWKEFRAPLLLVTDPEDQIQVRPRPLRVYDEVLAQESDGTWQPYVVADCEIHINHAAVAEMTVRIVRAPTVTTHMAGPRESSLREMLARSVREESAEPTDGNPLLLSNARRRAGRAAAVIASVVPPPIQILDPADPDFGAFLPMEGYL
jgi:hypothetical protein